MIVYELKDSKSHMLLISDTETSNLNTSNTIDAHCNRTVNVQTYNCA